MSTTHQVPVAEGLFTWPSDRPQLLASRCPTCGAVTFPRQPGCPQCAGDTMDDTLLPREGRLWTWTTQGFLPKAPYRGPGTEEDYEPYTLGYVELGGEVRVETRLVDDPEHLEIGAEMTLVVVPLCTDDDGNEVVTYAFRRAG